MRIAHKFRCAILQCMRQSNRRRADCGRAERCSTGLRSACATPYSIAGQFMAGQRDSAFRGGGNDFDSWPGTAVLDGLGNGRALRKLAVHFSAVWTLWDRGDPGVLWCCASALGLGTISTGALGASAWLGTWVSGAGAAAVWHCARHLHALGAVATAVGAGV